MLLYMTGINANGTDSMITKLPVKQKTKYSKKALVAIIRKLVLTD